jgi:mono/diheme cytochrome c family protein
LDLRADARLKLKGPVVIAALAAVVLCSAAAAQDAQKLKLGADIYERNCSPCHGARMLDPQGAADLRKFPHDQHERFVTTVTKGKNQMPPWGSLLKPEEVEALWTYVVNAESLYGH